MTGDGGLHAVLAPGLGRPVVIGEYPYYRAHPRHWSRNLDELRGLGVDVISCYLPWRFHEVPGRPDRPFDFDGETDPQRDVVALLGTAAGAGLGVLLKPGPFIHAEVQLGGLPDRLCDADRTPYTGLSGRIQTSQARPLPSLADPRTRAEVRTWLTAVAERVVAPHLAPGGPVVAVQVGNEGVVGEIHLPITDQDATAPVRAAFTAWLAGRGQHDAARACGAQPSRWPADLRSLWSQWSGQAVCEGWRWIADQLPPGVPTVVNVPLAPAVGARSTVDAWAARHRVIATAPHWRGHTEWIGNPASDPAALSAHLVEIRLGEADVVEANWGFTWADGGFAEARVPMFNAMLALMLGSTTVSVYTACATGSWNGLIDMDPDGLRAEGIDPRLHAPPYCPGAPVIEPGGLNPTAEALRRLSVFLDGSGDLLLGSELVVDGVLRLDRALPDAEAWRQDDTAPSALQQVVAAVGALLLHRSVLVDPRWLDPCEPAAQADDRVVHGVIRAADPAAGEPAGVRGNELRLAAGGPAGAVRTFVDALVPGAGPSGWTGADGRVAVLRRRNDRAGVDIIGWFNPSGEDGQVTRDGRDGRWTADVPAGAAAIAVVSGGRILDWLSTPPAVPEAGERDRQVRLVAPGASRLASA